MTSEHTIEQASQRAALFAAGALSVSERDEFLAHLETGCPLCRAELDRYAPLVTLLTKCGPSAPIRREIRARILEQFVAEHASPADQTATPALALVAGEAVTPAPAAEPPGCVIVPREEGTWVGIGCDGVEMRTLFVDKVRRQFTALVRMRAGAVFPPHRHEGAEECLVLEGDLRVGDQVLRPGDFLRTAPGFEQASQTTEQGCLIYVTSPFK